MKARLFLMLKKCKEHLHVFLMLAIVIPLAALGFFKAAIWCDALLAKWFGEEPLPTHSDCPGVYCD